MIEFNSYILEYIIYNLFNFIRVFHKIYLKKSRGHTIELPTQNVIISVI